MKPWDTVRREVLGAWRSVRYDLDHRSTADVESKTHVESGTPTGAGRTVGFDGASAPVGFGAGTPGGFDGASTPVDGRYGCPLPERESMWAPLREPRRMMAALAVASVVAASATGAFFAVSGGLGVVLVDSSASPAAPQTAPANAPRVVTSATPHRHVQASLRPSPSPSASVRASASPTRPAGAAKPSPTVAPTRIPPSSSPTPESASSATPSNEPLPSATPAAGLAP